MNIAIMNRAILLNEEGTGDTLRLLENALRVSRFDILANGGRGPLTDDQRRAIFAKSGSRGSERAEAAAQALPPWQKPQGLDKWDSEIRATTAWDKADRLLGRLMRVGDVTTTLTEDDPKWKWVLGTAAGMMLPTPGGKIKALGKADDAADAAKGIWALARNSLARKLGLSDDLRKGLPGITDHLDNILTKTDDYDGILKQAAKDYENGDRFIQLPILEQKVAPVADRMAATRIQSAVQDAERLAESIPAGHYDTALDLADKRVIDAVAAGDEPTKKYLEELWWDKKDLFRDPVTSWVNYNEMAGYLTDVVSGAGKSTVVSGMPAAPLASLKAAEKLAAAKQTVSDLRSAYRHKEADAVIKSMGDAWPKYVPKPEPPLTKRNWYDAWEDQYGNRSLPELFANALHVAREDVLANAIQSDSQRRAVFAKMRYSSAGGNTGSASQGGGSSRQAVATPQTAGSKTAPFGGGNPVARGTGPLVAIPADPNAGKVVASATRETVAELRMAQAAKAAESALQAYGPTSNQYIDALERSIAAREAYQKTEKPATPSVEDLLKSALSAVKESQPIAVQPVKPKEQVVTAQTEVDPSPPKLMDPKKQPTGSGQIKIPNALTQERMKKIMARYR